MGVVHLASHIENYSAYNCSYTPTAVAYKLVHEFKMTFLYFVGVVAVDLVEEAVPKSGRLPDGVSVVYDEISHVHALQFSSSASKVSFPSKQIFKNCNIFPEEFSVFLIIKHFKNYVRNECLLTIIDVDKTIFSIQLTKAHVILIYNKKKVIFRNFALKDNLWHSVGFSVTGRHVIMTTDCVNKRRKRLRRKFPSLIQLNNSTMHIASCRNKGIFQV